MSASKNEFKALWVTVQIDQEIKASIKQQHPSFSSKICVSTVRLIYYTPAIELQRAASEAFRQISTTAAVS